jgi:capsule polysaccharide export protein KpsE/RkpR
MESKSKIEQQVSPNGSGTGLSPDDIKNGITLISEIILFFLARKNKILRSVFLVGIVSTVFLFIIPKQYKAMTSFIPPPPDFVSNYDDELSLLSLSTGGLSLPKFGGNLFGKNPNDLYIQILRSRKINEFIIKKYNLMEELHKDYIEDALKSMEKIVDIQDEDGLIQIEVETKIPELSTKIANEYVDQLSLLLSKLNKEAASKGKNFLKERLQQVHTTLILASRKLKDFQVNNKMIDMEKQGEALIQGIADLQTQVISSESELKALKTTFTEESPKVKMMEARLSSLKKELNQIKGKNLKFKNSKSDDSLISDINLLDIPTVGIDYVDLFRDVKIMEEVFILLNKEYEFSRIKEAKGDLQLKVIDVATIATKKSSPKRTLILILIIFLTVIINFCLTMVRFILSKLKIYSPESHETLNNLRNSLYYEIFFWKKIK